MWQHCITLAYWKLSSVSFYSWIITLYGKYPGCFLRTSVIITGNQQLRQWTDDCLSQQQHARGTGCVWNMTGTCLHQLDTKTKHQNLFFKDCIFNEKCKLSSGIMRWCALPTENTVATASMLLYPTWSCTRLLLPLSSRAATIDYSDSRLVTEYFCD